MQSKHRTNELMLSFCFFLDFSSCVSAAEKEAVGELFFCCCFVFVDAVYDVIRSNMHANVL